ncbi:MAG: hypothetical protein LBI42_15810 [Chitinispirillales bacterium]|jgi:hypothetical protein|nr:hypothetical protein [Chitinispirillales bacterium]
MEFKYSCILTISVFLSCGITNVEAKPVDALPAFEQKIIANEKKLIKMVEQKSIRMYGSIVDVFNLLSKEEADYRRSSLIFGLGHIGTGLLINEGYNGLVREPLIVELLVCALSDNELRVRELAFKWLTDHTEWRLLLPFKSDIQKAITKHDFADPVKLLCLVNLTESEKKQWLKSEKTHTLAQRAALGDRKSEDSLITLFKEAKIFDDFENVAADLAFVGSQKSRIALVKGLETDISKILPATVISVSGISAVITELRRLHPDEPLLNSEFRNLQEPIYTKTGIIDDPKIKDYLTKLAKWAESTYGVKLNLPKENSFIRTKSNIFGGSFTPMPIPPSEPEPSAKKNKQK